MGTSFVAYKGHGFWSWDGYLEHFLFLLAEAIGPSPAESWLNEVRDHWSLQASGIFGGWIHPQLDEFVTSEERRRVILELIDRVVSAESATDEVTQTADFTRSLLIGELTTDESSPLDYMVHGTHPYAWWVQQNATRDTE